MQTCICSIGCPGDGRVDPRGRSPSRSTPGGEPSQIERQQRCITDRRSCRSLRRSKHLPFRWHLPLIGWYMERDEAYNRCEATTMDVAYAAAAAAAAAAASSVPDVAAFAAPVAHAAAVPLCCCCMPLMHACMHELVHPDVLVHASSSLLLWLMMMLLFSLLLYPAASSLSFPSASASSLRSCHVCCRLWFWINSCCIIAAVVPIGRHLYIWCICHLSRLLSIPWMPHKPSISSITCSSNRNAAAAAAAAAAKWQHGQQQSQQKQQGQGQQQHYGQRTA